ncbi:MAG: MaoC/PaaZ C-terminal domain-containing protein [Jatrophihabitans sp.]
MEAEFLTDALGVWSDAERFEVTKERIGEYAAATNDPIEAHRSGAVAPPVFAIVPSFMSVMQTAFTVAPAEVALRTVHGRQDFHFHRPIRPGDVIETRAKPLGFAAGRSGTTTAFLLECRTPDGEVVNEQYMTAFFRGVDAGRTVGDLAPSHAFPEQARNGAPVAKVVAHIDDDQTFRYAPASGDPMPIHLDEDAAKGAGLPGIIIHGLCTQAFTSWAVLTEVGGADVNRLKRLAVSFAKPVLPGQEITTTIWRLGSADGVTSYVFEGTVGDTVVIKDGFAEIAEEQ